MKQKLEKKHNQDLFFLEKYCPTGYLYNMSTLINLLKIYARLELSGEVKLRYK